MKSVLRLGRKLVWPVQQLTSDKVRVCPMTHRNGRSTWLYRVVDLTKTSCRDIAHLWDLHEFFSLVLFSPCFATTRCACVVD